MEVANQNLRNLQSLVEKEDEVIFQVSHGMNIFKQSSTSLLSITFIIFIAYSVGKFIQNKNTAFGLDVSTISIINH
jgi:hypothetical protein